MMMMMMAMMMTCAYLFLEGRRSRRGGERRERSRAGATQLYRKEEAIRRESTDRERERERERVMGGREEGRELGGM